MNKLMILMLMVAMLLLPAAAANTSADVPQANTVTANPAVAELEAKGDALRKQKDFAKAIQAYSAALRKDRNNALLLNKIGLAKMQMGDYRAAQIDFEKSVKRNKNYAPAWNNLGAAYHAQKKYDSAVKNYKKALALDESDAVFHANLGNSWFLLNKIDRATAEFNRAVELDPNVFGRLGQVGVTAQISTPEERARFSYTLAKIYAARGDADRAVELLKKAKEEGYRVSDVYRDPEFTGLRQDPRLTALVPPPAATAGK